MKRFVDRVVVITAAGRGIGRATALRFAREGARVYVADADADALAEAGGEAARSGSRLATLVMDCTDEASIRAGVASVLAREGRVDVLVNNAGGSLHTPYRFLDESDDDWKRVFDLNLMGTVWACRTVLPAMVANGGGRIVNLGSKAGQYASLIAGANYAAAKGAIASLTRQLAMEFGPSGITVNCVCPGVVLTERTSRLWAERRTPEERARVLGEIPLRRHATAEDIAGAVTFFAGDDAAFITGATLDVNGGQAMA